jgi:hypothetical protein
MAIFRLPFGSSCSTTIKHFGKTLSEGAGSLN